MERKLECLESALSRWKQKYEELKESKLKNMKEVRRQVVRGRNQCSKVRAKESRISMLSYFNLCQKEVY